MDRQTLILKKLEAITTESGFTFIRNGVWANTGTCEIIEEDLTCLLRFYYNFQNGGGYFTLQFYPGDKPAVATCGFTDKNCIKNTHLDYNDTKGQKALIRWFEDHLDAFTIAN